jgi:hypothetical protein
MRLDFAEPDLGVVRNGIGGLIGDTRVANKNKARNWDEDSVALAHRICALFRQAGRQIKTR